MPSQSARCPATWHNTSAATRGSHGEQRSSSVDSRRGARPPTCARGRHQRLLGTVADLRVASCNGDLTSAQFNHRVRGARTPADLDRPEQVSVSPPVARPAFAAQLAGHLGVNIPVSVGVRCPHGEEVPSSRLSSPSGTPIQSPATRFRRQATPPSPKSPNRVLQKLLASSPKPPRWMCSTGALTDPTIAENIRGSNPCSPLRSQRTPLLGKWGRGSVVGEQVCSASHLPLASPSLTDLHADLASRSPSVASAKSSPRCTQRAKTPSEGTLAVQRAVEASVAASRAAGGCSIGVSLVLPSPQPDGWTLTPELPSREITSDGARQLIATPRTGTVYQLPAKPMFPPPHMSREANDAAANCKMQTDETLARCKMQASIRAVATPCRTATITLNLSDVMEEEDAAAAVELSPVDPVQLQANVRRLRSDAVRSLQAGCYSSSSAAAAEVETLLHRVEKLLADHLVAN